LRNKFVKYVAFLGTNLYNKFVNYKSRRKNNDKIFG